MSGKIKEITATPPGREWESAAEFLWELISCWLLAIGTCLLLDVQFPLQAGVLPILWQTLLTLVITALITSRWWITVSAIVVTIGGTLIGLAASGHMKEYLAVAWDFFLWWLNNLPQDSPWYSAASLSIVHGLIHIGVSAFLFVMMRATRRTWPVLLLCVGMLILILAVGDTRNNAIAIAAYLAGLFPLMARDQYTGRRLFSRKNKFRILGARWLVATASGVLCIAVAAGMLLLLPQDTRNIRTRWCSDITSDLQSATGWYTAEQRQTPQVTLRDLGLQSSYYRIGGNLDKPESKQLATVQTDSQQLLRVTSFDTFTGKLWTNAFETSYRVGGYWEEKQTQALSAPLWADENWKTRLGDMLQQKDVTITLKAETPLLMTLGHTLGITENASTKNPLQFNSKGQLFSYFTMPQEYSYTLSSLSFATKLPLTDQQYMLLFTASSVGADPLYDDADFRARYTALPDEFSPQAQKIASNLISQLSASSDVITTYEKAYAISRYFTTDRGYSYTETPGRIGKEENVVDKLLQTKKGHCLYYATAMATMTRSIGIPSRLVAGYRTVKTDVKGVQAVDASQPYAWVECYFRHLGWVAFDPTPSKRIVSKPQSATPPPIPETPQEEPDVEMPEPEEDPTDEKRDISPGVLLLALLLLMLLILVLRTLLIHRAYEPKQVVKRYPATRQQTEHYYQDILRQLRCLGYRLQPGETLGELISRLRQPLDENTITAAKQALVTIHAVHYGAATPTDGEAAQLALLWQRLDAATRQHMPWPLFILRRRVLLPYGSWVVRRYR